MGELTPPPPQQPAHLRPAVPSHRDASFCLECPPPPHLIFSCYRTVQIDVFHRIILISFGPKRCLPFNR